jgi:hypothetical protein
LKMANVLTNLAADIYTAVDNVSRELVGFIPSVNINGGSERAAKGDTVRAAFTPSVSTADRTAAMTIPEGTDQTVANKTMTLSNDKSVQIPWTGEDIRHVRNGAGYETIYGQQIEQAFRAHANQIEAAIASACNLGASRAYGTAGTTPFSTSGDFTDASEALRILKDNGAPQMENSLVMNTAAGAKFLGLQSRYDVSGDTTIRRQGIIQETSGLALRESAQVVTFTAGTGASATTDTTGYAIGSTTITLASAGTGTILAGDVITFAGDTNKYVVVTGDADVSNGGTVVLQEPGLRKALAASAIAITVVASSARNIVLHRGAVELAIRAPAMPDGGDAAVDNMMVQDPRSGLVFDIRAYKGYGKAMFDISAVWGIKVWKPEHVGILLG